METTRNEAGEDRSLPVEAAVEATARACHEVNRSYCLAIGDESQLPWELTPHEIRESARCGVRGVIRGNGPRESHQSWFDFKVGEGWVWGPKKNPETREHPCMVPYDDLPAGQRQKDAIFVETARAMLIALGAMTTTSEIDRAAMAYDAYGRETEYKNFQGNPMPNFEVLPPPIGRAWVAAARRAKALP